MGYELSSYAEELKIFHKEREWEQFHAPKNLVLNLCSEAGELAEHFRWLTDEESKNLDQSTKLAVGEELADVLGMVVSIADHLDIDLLDAAFKKLKKNAENYPISRAKGNCAKYSGRKD